MVGIVGMSSKLYSESIFVRAGRNIVTLAFAQGTPFVWIGNGGALGGNEVGIGRGEGRIG